MAARISAITRSAASRLSERMNSPNLVEVRQGFRVEVVYDHEPGWERRAAALFSRKWASTSSPGMGFTLPLFRSSWAVEHFASLRKLKDVSFDDIPHQF